MRSTPQPALGQRARTVNGSADRCFASLLVFTLLLLSVAFPAAALALSPDPSGTTPHWDAVEPLRRSWIYFTDKGYPSELAASLDRAASALDPHAARRRAKTLGSRLVDIRDLPVRPDYIREVEQLGAVIIHRSRWLNAVSISAGPTALERVRRLPFVRAVTSVASGRPARPVPSLEEPRGDNEEAQRPAALDYGESFGQLDEIGIVAAHDLGLSGAGVRIAFMDTGYFRDHPVFARVLAEGRLLAQWDFINNDGETQDEPEDPEGQQNHGTSVWSLVGGYAAGTLIGAAYGADFLLAKTEDTADEQPIEEDNWVAAMEWADSLGADVISTSLNYIDWYTYEDMDGDTAPITIAADIAASRGIVVAVAAGNWGTQDWYYIGAPADADSILAVGGTLPDGTLWSDSSHGPTYDGRTKPEVCARGSGTWCARVPGGHGGPDLYTYYDGTSVACPLVAGAAALLLEAHPEWPAMTVRDALLATADQADHPDNDRGWGRIDALRALSHVTAAPTSALTNARLCLLVVPNPSPHSVWIGLEPSTVGPPSAESPPVADLSSLSGAPSVLQADRVAIFTVAGALVRTLHALPGAAGVVWDGRDGAGRKVPAGAYWARLESGRRQIAAPIIRLR